MPRGGKREGSGRKPWTPTAEQRKLIEAAIGGGFRIEDVAHAMGVDVVTLRKHCPKEIASAKFKRNAMVVAALYKNAMEGNVTAQIWVTKTQLGWKETSRLEHTGKDGDAITYEERLKQIDESGQQ